MSHRDPVTRYKTIGGAGGMVRVEVLVLLESRAEVIAMAARLRSRYRERVANEKLAVLYREAMEKFGTSACGT